MKHLFWAFVARIVTNEQVANWLIKRSFRTPYFHLQGYMHRWWLFNPTPGLNGGKGRKFEWLPSVRVHHILRADDDREHQHNHPWPARTFILRGWYLEYRGDEVFTRRLGDTAVIGADTFHTIAQVSHGGVWTLFISWKWKQVWGFKTPSGFKPWREYLDIPEGGDL